MFRSHAFFEVRYSFDFLLGLESVMLGWIEITHAYKVHQAWGQCAIASSGENNILG